MLAYGHRWFRGLPETILQSYLSKKLTSLFLFFHTNTSLFCVSFVEIT